MSFRLYSLVWAIPLQANEKLVLLKLVDHAADDGSNVRPSVAAIATTCGLSKRSVQMALRQLQKLGFVVLVKEADFAAKRPREYRIDVKEMTSSASANQCTTNTGEQYAPVNDVHRCIERHEPVHRSTRTGESGAPKSINEPINESIKLVPAVNAAGELSEAQSPGSLDQDPTLPRNIETPVGDLPVRKERAQPTPDKNRKRNQYPPDFEAFWKGYPTDANMSKQEAFETWRRISQDEREAAVMSLAAFRAYCSKNPTYRPIHACRYLAKKRFEGHLEVAEKISNLPPAIFVPHETPAWDAWRAHYLRTKRRGPPLSDTPHGRGWYFPAEFPPAEAEQCA